MKEFDNNTPNENDNLKQEMKAENNKKNINPVVKDILSVYKDGINSLFKSNGKNEENYFFILFKCPDDFSRKYTDKNELHSLSNSISFKNIIKYENEDINSSNANRIEVYTGDKYKIFLKNIFSKLFGVNEGLLKELIQNYSDTKNFLTKNEFDFEDFIYIFCSIIKYYSGLDITLELNKYESNLLLFIYGNEKTYENLCKIFNYQLQLKPIAIDYEMNNNKFKSMYKYEKDTYKEFEIMERNIKEPLLKTFNKENQKNKNLQIEDYDIDNPIFWPPYYSYKAEKADKFRGYEENDDYSYDIKKCSKFRNIDKLRLIQRALKQIMKYSELKKIDIFKMMFFKRNNVAYREKLKEIDVQKIYNPFDTKLCDKTINIIRNYFGESLSYYFLWLDYYSRMLIFPSVIGIFIFLSYFLWNKIPLISIFSNSFQMDYYDFLLILNCILLTLWLTLFIKTWAQKEKLYNYIWGISDSQKESKINEDFVPNSKEQLIFGYYVPKEEEIYHTLKYYCSYIVLLAMILLVLTFIYSLFRLKATLVNGDIWHDYKISFYIACINGFQIKLMNYIYYYIAKYLNEWENHFSINEKNNEFAKKLILFDFVNSYSSLFYIAFIKPYNEGCINNNCLKEIETQMYSIFLVYLSVFFGELIYLYMIYYYQKGKVGNLISEEKIEIQGLEHQMMTSPMDNLNIEYNDIINQFGFACLFSLAAPLTPFFIFLLSIVYRLTNYYKFIHLTRVDILDESRGISIYNKIIKVLLFIGVMVNVSIFLFSNHNPMSPMNTMDTIKNKFLTIFIIDNSLLLIYFDVDWNVLPKWFKYKDIIKDLYMNEYFLKDKENNN